MLRHLLASCADFRFRRVGRLLAVGVRASLSIRLCLIVRPARSASHFLIDLRLSPERFPASKPSALMSSSNDSQRIPSPPPINRHALLSPRVAWTSRGNQSSGADTIRPSPRRTTSAESVTRTAWTTNPPLLDAEEVMPTFYQILLVKANEAPDLRKHVATNPSRSLESNRIQPEFGRPVFELHMHMRWFIAIPGVDEKSERTGSKKGRHSIHSNSNPLALPLRRHFRQPQTLARSSVLRLPRFGSGGYDVSWICRNRSRRSTGSAATIISSTSSARSKSSTCT